MITASENIFERFGYFEQVAKSYLRDNMTPEIRLGTSAFIADGWPGSFYPEAMKPPDYLHYYATKFDTVEINSTFHRIPKIETVKNWVLKTAHGFIFSLVAPRSVTYDKILTNCDEEFECFMDAAHILGEKLGPIVLQFPHFSQNVFNDSGQFVSRLNAFLKKWSRDKCKFAVEIHNKEWLTPWLADQFRESNVALVLQDQTWMPRVQLLSEKFDLITADFAFIRWQGDHKGIQDRTRVWNREIFDRTAELRTWVDFCGKTQKRGIKQYIYANNHYAGYAPGTLELFRSLCHEKGIATPLTSAAWSERPGLAKCR
jgi:uncharacterized protein YecE (DUF72 family)